MTLRPTATAAALAALACPAPAAGPVSYDKDVRPLLRKHCLTCHNAERPRGDLDLSTYAAALAGSASGKGAIAGKPEESLIYTVTAHLEDPKMPPNKPKIPQRDLDTIRAWIETGLAEKPADTAIAVAPPPAAGLAAVAPFRRPTAVTALAVSPTGTVAAVSGNKQVLLFDLAAGKPLGGLPFPEGEVHSLTFSRDGTLLLAGGGVGGASGEVIGFEMPSGKRVLAAGEELDAVLAADVTADRSRIALGGPGRAVKLFAADSKPLQTFRKPTDWVTAVGFSPEGLLIAGSDRFGGLFVWEAASGKEFLSLRGHTRGITGLAWRADSNVLATASEDGTARLWDMHAGKEAATWDAHPGGVAAIAWHPSGRIATGGRDQRVKVWDAAGKPVADLGPAADVVTKVAFTADGSAVVSGDWSGDVRVWPISGGAATTLPLPVEPVAARTPPAPAPQMRAVPVRTVTPAPKSAKLDAVARELAAARAALAAANRAVAEAEKALKELAAEPGGR